MFRNLWNKFDFFKQKSFLKSIQNLDSEFESLSFSQLQQRAKDVFNNAEIFSRRHDKEKLSNHFLVEVYSLSKQFIKRKKKISLFPTQIAGSIVLNDGNICQMNTGEGKTLTAILPACLNSLAGKTVYVITTNDYLAKRDWEIAKPLFDFFGLESNVNLKGFSLEEKKKIYKDSSIIYTTANELCFDYLKYNLLCKNIDQKCRIKFDFVIIDEVDSILIDNSQNPLIVSSVALDQATNLDWKNNESKRFTFALEVVNSLNKGVDYEINEIERTTSLKESGIDKVQRNFGIKNLFSFENSEINFLIFNCLRVAHFFKKGIDYIVDREIGKIQLIDASTGRISHNRVYEYGIQQSIEAKEGVDITIPGRTSSKITFPNFFRMFEKISGMSGTAEFESKEFKALYGMEVIKIPPYKNLIRKDKNDVLFPNDRKRYDAVIKLVKKNLENEKRPMLIGVQDLKSSEYLSKLLKILRIKHYKLNAVNHKREAEIISKAGEIGSVTIATNMAGRGTDIIPSEESIKKGGMFIVVLGRSAISKRLDDQFIGRGGRQGNPGETVFFLSLGDEIFRKVSHNKSFMGFNEIFSNIDTNKKSDRLFTRIFNFFFYFIVSNYQNIIRLERYNFRKNTLEYDFSFNKGRKEFYDYREKILCFEDDKLLKFLLDDSDFNISIFKPDILYHKIRKFAISEADAFWSSYLKIGEKMLKLAFVNIYLQKGPQEEFFLKMNKIFENNFINFRLKTKAFVLASTKRFLLDLKNEMKKNLENRQ